MFKNKRVFIAAISLVVVTATITFVISAAFFLGWNYFNPNYRISFDPKSVNINNVKKFDQVKNILEANYYENVDQNAMIEGAIAGMAYSLKDPYTVYFTKEQMAAFMESSKGSFVGIGVQVTMESDGFLTILEAFEGSPAQKAGLKQGDRIAKVDDKDVGGMDEDLVISMIKGQENTSVKITVYRPSLNKNMDFNIVRKTVKTPNINQKLLQDNIGYIAIKQFDEQIDDYFERSLNDLLAQKIKGLVIDLRDNPGGSYDQVVKIADRLLPKGTIVYTEDKYKRREVESSDERELGLPLAVLVNGNSASASEVLAGAIKDYHKGTLVGTKTFGKGVVQAIKELDDGSGLKVTIARYFTPSGVCIHGIGIEPDEEVKLSEKYQKLPVSAVPAEEDTQLKRALDILRLSTK